MSRKVWDVKVFKEYDSGYSMENRFWEKDSWQKASQADKAQFEVWMESEIKV